MDTMLSSSTPINTSKARLLFVDDDPWLRKMVASLMANRDLEVRTASNGQEALKEIESYAPDIVVTDIDMPDMDGWALVRTLRTRPQTALTPVLMLTMLKTAEDRIRGFRLGADDYIEKPFRFEELDLRISKALRASQAARNSLNPQTSPTLPVVTALKPRGISGSLEEVGPAMLLVVFESEKKTGILRIRNARAGVKFTFSQGQLTRIDGEYEMTGYEDMVCLDRVLDWNVGSFEWQPGPVDPQNRLNQSVSELVLRVTLRRDERS